MNLAQLYRQCRKKLTHETADFDLSQLFHAQFETTIGLSRPEAEVPSDEVFVFQHKVKRLAEGYPLQYLLGEWEFYSIPLKVGEGVLIPRPDTETVVDEALALASQLGFEQPILADLCAGCGAIALALAKNIPDAVLYAVERSPAALRYLRENVNSNHCADRVHVMAGDVMEDLPLPKLHMIVSNPPYLTRKELTELPAPVRCEPLMAFDGGEDGLDFYRAIAQRAGEWLRPAGALVFEVGYRQAAAVEQILGENSFANIRVRKDLGGIERCVFGTKIY